MAEKLATKRLDLPVPMKLDLLIVLKAEQTVEDDLLGFGTSGIIHVD
jgi:hypothetical protein